MKPLLAISLVVWLGSGVVVAHSGRLDANGGHYKRKTGGYHYHGSPARSAPRTDYRTSPQLEPRSESRSIARTDARDTARETARTTAAGGVTWNFTDASAASDAADAIESESAPTPPALPVIYYELEKPQKVPDSKPRFLVAEAGNESSCLHSRRPSKADLLNKIASLSEFEGTVRFYLNGMRTDGLSWAHASVTEGDVRLWERDVKAEEFRRQYVLQLRHPLRSWKDATGQFAITARLFSRKGNVITLFASDGRRIEVDVDRLSADDITYLQRQ